MSSYTWPPESGGSSSGILSINGDTDQAQLIVGAGGIGVSTASGTTTITSAGIVEDTSGMIEAPTDKTYTLVEYAVYAFTINQLITKLAGGSCTIAIQINGVSVTGISAHSATTSQVISNASGANSVSVGQRVTMVVSSSSSPEDLAFTLKYTRA